MLLHHPGSPPRTPSTRLAVPTWLYSCSEPAPASGSPLFSAYRTMPTVKGQLKASAARSPCCLLLKAVPVCNVPRSGHILFLRFSCELLEGRSPLTLLTLCPPRSWPGPKPRSGVRQDQTAGAQRGSRGFPSSSLRASPDSRTRVTGSEKRGSAGKVAQAAQGEAPVPALTRDVCKVLSSFWVHINKTLEEKSWEHV